MEDGGDTEMGSWEEERMISKYNGTYDEDALIKPISLHTTLKFKYILFYLIYNTLNVYYLYYI